MKKWLVYAMLNNDFLFVLKILSILDGQCITQPLAINIVLLLKPEKVNALQIQGKCMKLNINSSRTLNSTLTSKDANNQPVYVLTKEF